MPAMFVAIFINYKECWLPLLLPGGEYVGLVSTLSEGEADPHLKARERLWEFLRPSKCSLLFGGTSKSQWGLAFWSGLSSLF